MKLLQENNEEKNPKKTNKLLILIIISIIIIAIISLTIFIIIVTSPSHKLKKYLEENNYICNNETCSKQINEENHIVNYKNGDIFINTPTYNISLNKLATLQINKQDLVCTFKYSNNLEPVTESLTSQTICNTYINTINTHINNYHNIIEQENIDFDKLVK